jgi:hypothetical protein
MPSARSSKKHSSLDENMRASPSNAAIFDFTSSESSPMQVGAGSTVWPNNYVNLLTHSPYVTPYLPISTQGNLMIPSTIHSGTSSYNSECSECIQEKYCDYTGSKKLHRWRLPTAPKFVERINLVFD